ncbi:MAG: Coenzyme F420 hydrogenase/dehydrogenase, beta subunit C-terminal domain [Candidatus Bathyarchaeia archaeon]
MQTAARPKLFGSLISEVLNRDLCTFCGACVASCPVCIIQVQDEKPTMKGKCELCQVCYYSCSAAEFPKDEVEQAIFGRTRTADEPIGIYKTIANARSKKQEILQKSQDGGVVTSILGYALESGKVDAAAVTGIDKQTPWKSIPRVAVDYADVLNAAGTKYTPAPTLIGLMSATEEYRKERVAVVGTPCQIRSYRRMQTSLLGARKLANAVSLAIGLFCMESYHYDQFIGDYLRTKNIDVSKVSRFAIKKGKFRVTIEGQEVLTVPIKELDEFIRSSCKVCEDFTAEFADMSVGGVGCPEGWCTVIARTTRGQEFLDEAEKSGWIELKPIDAGKFGMEQVLRNSARKKTSLPQGQSTPSAHAQAPVQIQSPTP